MVLTLPVPSAAIAATGVTRGTAAAGTENFGCKEVQQKKCREEKGDDGWEGREEEKRRAYRNGGGN